MPELGAVPLAKVARQRLQWASSLDSSVPRNFRRDLWQMDHLAGVDGLTLYQALLG